MAGLQSAGKIGVIGVGNMGLAIVQRLRQTGHQVLVRDLRPQAEANAVAVGAGVAPDPAAVARECACLIVAVVDAAQCEAALFGTRGAVHGLHAGATVLMCSTIAPHDVERFAARLREHEVDCIDAPMSGGPLRAREGRMSLMVACDDAVFARCESLLRVLSSRLFRVGQRPGDGARTKLVNNLLAAVNLAGAAEALALAERIGLDAKRTLEVIEQSSAQSWIGSDRLHRALAGDFAPRAHTTLLAKDSALALALARAAGAQVPMGANAQQLLQRAVDAGLGSLDDASLLTLLRRGPLS